MSVLPLRSGATLAQPRLAGQLEQLSAVAETLTLRLLELEERLAGHEQRLAAGAGAGREATDLDLQLVSTEERLGRLEGLLNDRETAGDRSISQWSERSDLHRSGEEAEEGPAAIAAAAASRWTEGDQEDDPLESLEERPVAEDVAARNGTEDPDDSANPDDPFPSEEEQTFLEELALG